MQSTLDSTDRRVAADRKRDRLARLDGPRWTLVVLDGPHAPSPQGDPCYDAAVVDRLSSPMTVVQGRVFLRPGWEQRATRRLQTSGEITRPHAVVV